MPTDLAAAPPEVVARLAERVGVALDRYSRETGERLRREHAALVVERAGWTSCGRGEWKALSDWLVARALEHDTTAVLFGQALDHLLCGPRGLSALPNEVGTVTGRPASP